MAKYATGSGRRAKRWSEGEARRVLAAWKKSGQSGGAFARAIGVTAQRLYWWRERLDEDGERLPTSQFVPIVVKNPAARAEGTAAIVVTTADGARLEVKEVSASTAAWIVAVLERGARS